MTRFHAKNVITGYFEEDALLEMTGNYDLEIEITGTYHTGDLIANISGDRAESLIAFMTDHAGIEYEDAVLEVLESIEN